MCASYFGMLALAILTFPRAFDWRYLSISQLLYPRQNPEFHAIASTGIAVTGVLMIPFAGYLQRRLRVAAPVTAKVAAFSMAVGIICLILAALISSHPLEGRSSIPKFHVNMARIAAIGIGVGLVVFAGCGVKGYFTLATGRKLYRRGLLFIWSLTILPALLVVPVWLVMLARFPWLDPVRRMLVGTVVWHLGFWEWIGSVTVFLFLGGSVWLLPEHAGD